METEKGLATRSGEVVPVSRDRELALYDLETRFAMAVKQRELLANYISQHLKPGKHFYSFDDEPGRKPSLNKEGAELVCLDPREPFILEINVRQMVAWNAL